MMPYIDETAKSRSFINEFRGYNHTPKVSEREIYDGYNVSGDEYPLLSIRAPRGEAVTAPGRIIKMLGGEELSLLYERDGRVFFKYGSMLTEDIGAYISGAGYQMVRMGANIVVYPNSYAYNTTTGKSERREHSYTVGEFRIVNCVVFNGGTVAIEVTKQDGDAGRNEYYLATNEAGKPEVRLKSSLNTGDTVVDAAQVYLRISGDGVLADKIKATKLVGFPEEIQIDFDDDYIYSEKSGYFLVRGIMNQLSVEGYYLDDGTHVLKYGSHGDLNCGATLRYKTDTRAFDYLVECKNRLWGCLNDGRVNEIYCSRLGSWSDFTIPSAEDAVLADAPAVISVGSEGDFTGACVVDDNPVFFKENIIHKVYVSSTGAHQLYNITGRGVMRGSGDSVARVGDRVIYHSRRGFVGFDGTNTVMISDALGDVRYRNAVAGADGDKYVTYCENNEGERFIFTYDTRYGFWHRELIGEEVSCMAELDGSLLMAMGEKYLAHSASSGEERIDYMLETGDIGFNTPDRKYICRMDIRARLEFGAHFNLWIQYDSDGRWIEVERLVGINPVPRTETLYIMPVRCDHFKIKVTGKGNFKLYGISRVLEESEDW